MRRGRVALVDEYVRENYPDTLNGISSRTTRTVLGTLIEVNKVCSVEHEAEMSSSCRYVYLSYLAGLLSIPLLTIALIMMIVSLIVNYCMIFMSSTINAMNMTFVSVLIGVSIGLKKQVSLLLKLCIGVLVGAINAIIMFIKIRIFNNKGRGSNIVDVWKEIKG